jgi:uncharacterized iron-regulated membrane protein
MALAAPRRILSTFLRRPQEVPLRRAIFQVHLWTGIGAGAYIFVVALTGALLMFRSEMQHAAFPQFFDVPDATGSMAAIGSVVDEFRRAYPDQSISGVETPTVDRQTFLTYVLRDGRYVAAFAHPTTGKVMGELPPDSFVSRLQDLHFELLGGSVGRTVNGIGALCLTTLALTGLVIWWPGIAAWRRALRVDFTRSWRRIAFDLHSAIGIWSGAFIFIWGVSGVAFIFSQPVRAAVGAISPLTPVPAVTSGPPREGKQALAISSFVDKALREQPDADLVRILLPSSDRAPFVVTMTHRGRTRAQDESGVSLYFDQFSGELLQTWDAAPRTAGDRFMAVLAPLHMGLFGGLGVKIVWAILGLAPAMLFATGFLIWWSRVIRDRLPKPRSTATAACAVTLIVAAASSRLSAQDALLQISHSGQGAYEASLAPLGDRVAATWYDTRDGHAEIYFTLLDGRGRPEGADKRLTVGTAAAYEPDIEAVDTGVAIAWYEKAANGALTARLGLWSQDGLQRWTTTLSADGRFGRNPVVRAFGGKLFAAWIESPPGSVPGVWGQWFDLKGMASAPPFHLAAAGTTTWNLNAAFDQAGRAWVVFDAKAETHSDELFLVRIEANASRAVRLTADDGLDSKYPDLAFSGDRVAITWFDKRDGNEEVYLFAGSAAELTDLTGGIEPRARRITQTPGESIGAYLAWNGRRLGLAWCDNSEGKQHEIFFQPFNEAGEPVADARRLTHNPTWSLIPAIRPWRGGFVLAWNEFTPGRLGTPGSDGRSEVMFTVMDATW